MTPGARAQAAIELLDAMVPTGGRMPADAVASEFFRQRRYIGSKDRNAVSTLTYGVLRRRGQLDWWLGRLGLTANNRGRVIAHLALADRWQRATIAEAFDGGKFRPAPLSPDEDAAVIAFADGAVDHPAQPGWVAANAPEWLWPRLEAEFGRDLPREMAALNESASTDLRANVLVGTRDQARAALARAGIPAQPTHWSPWGLRLEHRVQLFATEAFRSGLVEIQDEGSQLAALLVQARPGQRVCDFCAGAGGKTLALAASMANKGHIVACDVSARRLEGAVTRLRRARVFNVEHRPLTGERDRWVKRHAGAFDRVLVDAPCTGTGTWRRNPDARWSLAPSDIDELTALQARILDSAARLAKPGGRLVYVTCSLLADENARQAEAFAAAHEDFGLVPVSQVWAEAVGGPAPEGDPYLRLTPARHGTDGFFVAIFERRA